MKKQDVNRMEIKVICGQIKKLVESAEANTWEIGDLLVRLSTIKVSGKPLSLKELHKEYLSSFSYPYLSQMRNCSKAFPPSTRKSILKSGAGWYECDLARRSKSSCVKAGVAQPDEPLSNFVEFILKHKGKRRINQRAIVKDRIEKAAEETVSRRAFQVELLKSEQTDWLSNCHHASCVNVMDDLESDSVDLVHLDPPYGAFYKVDDGRFSEPETKGLATDCDNKTRDEALSITLEALKSSARVLNEQGKILLYQAATEPDRPEIIMLLRELGFNSIIPFYWKKRIAQPGSFKIPFSHETERILIAARNREAFESVTGGAGRTDVINDDVIAKLVPDAMEYEELPPSRKFYHEVRNGQASYGDRHFFEKPIGINKFFLEKLTLPGDRVVDAFGCTGSMVEACIELNRRWVYCESNETNYNLGVGRISDALNKSSGTTSVASAPI